MKRPFSIVQRPKSK